MNSKKYRLPIFLYVGVLLVNASANILPINGISTGAVSDSVPSLFTPVAFTFSIWGVIYLLLAFWLMVPVYRDQRLSPAGSAFFSISCLGNMAWMFLWHYQIWWATEVAMLVILFSLIALAVEMRRSRFSQVASMRIPISIYLGWISVATVANTSILLITRGFDGFGQAVYWTMAMLIVVLLLGVYALRARRDWAFALVLIWANFGIYWRWQGDEILLAGTAFVTMILLGLGILLVLVKKEALF
jgi:hypothetical protein